ncbi:MAG TPA: pyridoxamine 5'-phosphate oxidase family protein [Candidatus Acidoferrales bacterium]|nr:pyridoxamine 5'-phosphate oxidase family protein [Candidatus Acidoferrales bacterium]
MSLLANTPGLLVALRGERTPKFLATRSAARQPNVVPCLSLTDDDGESDLLFFGNFLLRKTVKNLEGDSRVGLLVLTPQLQGWILTADFLEFQRTGSYVERQNSSRMLRYNAYTGIRSAGLLRLRSVEAAFSLSRLQVAKEIALARWAALHARSRHRDGVRLPPAAHLELSRTNSVKVMTWIGTDGYPFVVPALSLQPKGSDRLVVRVDQDLGPCPQPTVPALGGTVAANVLTEEAVSYQTKGSWEQTGKTGTIRVQSVYAGGPPIPGARVA